MYGLEAIYAHNGWAISVLGISIVFTGLCALSFAIAQLHKLLDFWDHRDTAFERFRRPRKAVEKGPVLPDMEFSQDIYGAVRQFRLLADYVGDPIPLPKLLALAKKTGQARPHSTLNQLLKAGVIHPADGGYFKWNEDLAKKLLTLEGKRS